MGNNRKQGLNFLLFMLSMFVAASIFFLDGFFQVSKNNIGKTRKQHYHNIEPNMLDEYRLQPPSAKYDQTVFMIIDAWRTDHPNATNMPFAYEHACNHLKIKVDLPTVTMPRLKSLTTGRVSNFIDIVLNLGHTTELDESILHRLIDKNKKSVFAGDRTWIQLFPHKFLRAAVNTDSFFVNDFYKGDLNVTTVLKKELENFDWHLMVLHYLGLDHIGHVEGSHSDKIYIKLFEMDDIVKYIAANMDSRRLLLLTGDHGMRNGGSHGGSDKEELYVPLMTFRKICDEKKRSFVEHNQIDIAATLAVLLDVKIPHTSVGCLIPEMLEIYSKEEQLFLFYYNTLHLMEKLNEEFSLTDLQNEDYITWYTKAKASHKEFILSQASSFLSYETAKQNYIRLSKKISKVLSESSVQYSMQQIIIALTLTTLCALKLLINVFFEDIPNLVETTQFFWKKFLVCFFLAGCINLFENYSDILNTHNLVRSIIFTCQIALNIYFALDILKIIFTLIIPPLMHKRKVKLRWRIPIVLLTLFLGHSLSLASSSFIEEEHQTWYYFTQSILVFLTLHNFYNHVKSAWQRQECVHILLHELWNLRSSFIVFLSSIGLRRLNQSGDKWRDMVDIGDVLSRSQNHFYLAFTLLAGLILLMLLLKKYNSPLELFFCFIALSSVFLYRQLKQHSFLALVSFWTSIFCTQLSHCRNFSYKRKYFGYESKKTVVKLLATNLTCFFLISALLHRPHNVILLPALLFTLEKSYFLCDSLHIRSKKGYSRCYVLALKTVITIFIANMFYFFQGNSNSLATIDLNPGYIGLSSYNPLVVGLLITLNTFCAQINSFLYLMLHMFSTQRNTLPLCQKNERTFSTPSVESTEEDLYLVYSLFTASTIMHVAFYWCLLLSFRYHLFIYSVFAPKALYECLHLLVFYINFIVTNLYFRLYFK